MTARKSEHSERTRLPAGWRDDALFGRVLPQDIPITTAWLQRAIAACYNPATETIRKIKPSRFLTGRHSRLLSLFTGARPVVYRRHRLPSGAQELRSAVGFLLHPRRPLAYSQAPSRLQQIAYARDVRREPQPLSLIWFPEAFFFAAPPHAGSCPASASRFTRTFVRLQHHDFFRASAIFRGRNGN